MALVDAGRLRNALLRAADVVRRKLEGAGQPGRRGTAALKPARRRLLGYAHRLRALHGRRRVSANARETLLAIVSGLTDDLDTLRKSRRRPRHASAGGAGGARSRE